MLTNITTNLPAIKKSSSNFYKSHSQFMGVMLDVTAITPIRSVKHTLAELDKTRMALEEAHLKMKKKDIELREKEHKLATDENLNEFEKELLEVEILEIKVNMNNIQNSITGAVRKMSFFTTQYKSILEKLGKDDITEEEYEKEESRYHGQFVKRCCSTPCLRGTGTEVVEMTIVSSNCSSWCGCRPAGWRCETGPDQAFTQPTHQFFLFQFSTSSLKFATRRSSRRNEHSSCFKRPSCT